MMHWLALYTKPHQERIVQAKLVERGIPVYFPTVRSIYRQSLIERPFFPRYLFAQCDLDHLGESTLKYVPGLKELVMVGGVPARVDDRVIARLRERLTGMPALSVYGEVIRPGDRVRIGSGSFADVDALFDTRLSGSGRIRVLVYWLSRWTPVQVDAGVVRKVGGVRAPIFAPVN